MIRTESRGFARAALRAFLFAVAVALTAAGARAQEPESCADCAKLGRIAANLQLKALQAEEVVRVDVPTWLSDAKILNESTIILHNDEVKALRDRADAAKAEAEKLAQEAEKAWQAYHDCLKKAKCPPPGSGGNSTPGFMDCPEAQEWLNSAARLHQAADHERELAAAAQAGGDAKSAESLDLNARMFDADAREREREAAMALQTCPEKTNVATGPAGGGNFVPASQLASSGVAVPPGAMSVPRDSHTTAKITIKNDCPTAESFRIETTGLPAGLIEADDPLRVDTESSREFSLTYNTAGLAPVLYSGTISVICTTCGTSCPRPRKDFPIQIFIPAQ